MTHAKVKVDPSLRVVEVASGNPEEMTVSTTPPFGPPPPHTALFQGWRNLGDLGDLMLEFEDNDSL